MTAPAEAPAGPPAAPAPSAPRSWWPWVLGCLGLAGGAALFAGAGTVGLLMLAGLFMEPEPEPGAGPGTGAGTTPVATRPVQVSDLAGEWGNSDGINTTYVDRATGVYAGTDSIHTTEKWTIDAEGGITSDFFGIQNGRRLKEQSKGKVRLEDRTLYLVLDQGSPQKFVLREFKQGPTGTLMVLTGPWYDSPIPPEIFTDPAQGANLNQKWFRKP